MKVFVTGHAGFIGRYLTEALTARGGTVTGLDKRPFSSSNEKLDSRTGDVLDRDAVMSAMKGCDAIIHLAAEHQDWGISRDEYFEANQGGTKNLLACATQLGIRQFVFYSSVAVYGTSLVPTVEERTPAPDNDYGASKLAAEKELESWAAADKKNCALVIRPTVVFGPRMNDYSNIFRLVDQIAKHRFLYIGKMHNTKSLAYVENLVDATLYLMQKIAPGVQVFNYTEQTHLTSRQIAAHISKALGVYLPPVSLPLKPMIAAASVLDVAAKRFSVNLPITAARIKKVNTPTHHRSDKLRLDGFEPRFSIYDGLDKACDWYKSTRSSSPCCCSK